MSQPVNFSERTPKRGDDGHDWKRHYYPVFDDGEQWMTLQGWRCERCRQRTIMNPMFIRSEDRKECQADVDH